MPNSWVAVSTASPCEQIATAWCEQPTAPLPAVKNSHPPIAAIGRPAITRISAVTSPCHGPSEALAGEIAGAAAGARLAG